MIPDKAEKLFEQVSPFFFFFATDTAELSCSPVPYPCSPGPALLWVHLHVSEGPALSPGLTTSSLSPLSAAVLEAFAQVPDFPPSVLPFIHSQELMEGSYICIWPRTLIETFCPQTRQQSDYSPP